MKTSLGMILIGVISGITFAIINSFINDMKGWELTLVYLILSIFFLALWFNVTKEIIKGMDAKEINQEQEKGK